MLLVITIQTHETNTKTMILRIKKKYIVTKKHKQMI